MKYTHKQLKMNSFLIIVVIFIQQITTTLASEGDMSPFYQKCVRNCAKDYCDIDNEWRFKSNAVEELDVWVRLLWNCRDDCRYKCMWRTVQGFQERGYPVPKFHGKWPFTRMFGVQEPGSALASLLNLATHVYMIREVDWRFPTRSTPFVLFWHAFAGVCINAWVWSTIFHIRDTPFTEFMDYACALSMVMSLFIAAVVRVFHRRMVTIFVMLMFSILYYVQHVKYLYRGIDEAIDYGYNMQVNLAFGVVGSLMWLAWAVVQSVRGVGHAWRVGAFTLASGVTLALELLDFAPRFAVWDAHALWHLSTAPLPLLFYRFVIDDLYYMYPTRLAEKSDYHKLT